MQEKGSVCFVKHFFLNDQEDERHGIATWANEQTIRECYLPAFRYTVTLGGGMGFMNSFNRIGMIWPGEHRNSQIVFLEEECGFEGNIVTDMYEADYQDVIDGIQAGTTMWLSTASNEYGYGLLTSEPYRNDPVIVSALVEAAHRMLYGATRSGHERPELQYPAGGGHALVADRSDCSGRDAGRRHHCLRGNAGAEHCQRKKERRRGGQEMKRLSRILLTALAAVLTVSLAACGSGVKVPMSCRRRVGQRPASGSYEPYEQVVLPTAEATKDHAQQVGWQDAGGSYFANGSTSPWARRTSPPDRRVPGQGADPQLLRKPRDDGHDRYGEGADRPYRGLYHLLRRRHLDGGRRGPGQLLPL